MSLTLVSPLFSFQFEELMELGQYTVPSMKLNGIYCISCSETSLIYVGSAGGKAGLSGRFDCHMRRLKEGKHHSWILQRDYKRHGIKHFYFHALEFCQPIDCVSREQIYLDLTKAGNEYFSYNISPTATSNLGMKHSRETIEKRTESLKLRYQLHPRSEETKRKISEAQKGKRKLVPMPEETREKISEANKKRVIPEKQIEHIRQLGIASKGKKATLETRKKLSDSHKGYITPDSQRENLRKALLGREITEEARAKVRAKKGGRYLITDPNGNTQEFVSLTYFCKLNGLQASNMSSVARGKLKQHKGWTCKRID